jgi:alpha-beta hydrolase superfamily lysophospholipase
MEITGDVVELVGENGTLRYRRWSGSGELATAFFFNGIMSHSGWFSPLAGDLVAAGIHMVGADRRGSGPNTDARGDAESVAMLTGDARRIIAAERKDGSPLVVVGWCWGAILAVHVAAALGDELAGLVLVTPGLFPSLEVRERAAAGLAQAAGRAPEDPCVPMPIRDELFTEGPALDGFIRRDPLRLSHYTPRFAELSGKLSAMATARLARLRAPIMLVLAEDDGATDNAATARALEVVPEPQRRVVTLPTRHGVIFEAPRALSEAIVAFARDKVAAR